MMSGKSGTGLFQAIALSIGLLVVVPSTVFAESPPAPAAAPPEAAMTKQREKVISELKLDDKQRKLFTEAGAQMRNRMDGGREMHGQIRDMVHSENYDEKKVRALIEKYNGEMEEKTVTTANAMHAFYQSLNPEQKEKLKSMQGDRREEIRSSVKAQMKEKMADHPDSKE